MDRITIPFSYWAVPLIVLGAFAAIRYVLSKKRTREKAEPSLISDKAIPPAGVVAGKSFFSRWDARCRIVSLLIFMIFAVLTDDLHVLSIYLLFTLSLFFIARMPAGILVRRFKAVVPFLFFMAFFIVLLSRPGTSPVTVVFEPLGAVVINRDALATAARISLKALVVVSVMPIMIDTAPYGVTVLALRSIGIPESVAQILLLAYRYIFLFKDEALRMHRAMRLRGFSPRSDIKTIRISGNFLAMIFVRSYERTQRIHDAMVARGYRGKMLQVVSFRMSPGDVVMAFLWVGAGLIGWLWSWTGGF